MARQVDIIALESGIHYILFGFDDSDTGTFKLQMWITKYGERMCDWIQAMSLNFISFMGSDLWVHNDKDKERCSLFGEKKDCIVGVISNEEPTKVKIFDSLGIHTDGEWEITEITIPASLNYPNGMYSKIPYQRFFKREGVWQAHFLRNMKTNSATTSVVDAINGEELRGYVAYMLLKNTSDDQVKLFGLDVNMTKSRV